MSQTLAEQLTSVQAAIAAVESGAQSISLDGANLIRPNLKELCDREERLLKRIDREGKSRFTSGEF